MKTKLSATTKKAKTKRDAPAKKRYKRRRSLFTLRKPPPESDLLFYRFTSLYPQILNSLVSGACLQENCDPEALAARARQIAMAGSRQVLEAAKELKIKDDFGRF